MTARELLINPRAPVVEWARAAVENMDAPWWKRVVSYPLEFGIDGEPLFKASREGEVNEAEYRGMIAMRDMARMGMRWVVWISPKGGNSSYPESRFCVGRTNESKMGVRIETWGICGDQNGTECVEIAKKMVEAGGVMFERPVVADDLRERPVGLDMDDDKVFDLLRHLIKIDGVWEAIADGRVEKNNANLEDVMYNIVAKMPQERHNWDGRQIQMFIEQRLLATQNIRLRGGGNHGGSVMGVGKGGVFDRIFSTVSVHSEAKSDKLKFCEKHGVYFMATKKTCPLCMN